MSELTATGGDKSSAATGRARAVFVVGVQVRRVCGCMPAALACRKRCAKVSPRRRDKELLRRCVRPRKSVERGWRVRTLLRGVVRADDALQLAHDGRHRCGEEEKRAIARRPAIDAATGRILARQRERY